MSISYRLVPDRASGNLERAGRVTPRELAGLISRILVRAKGEISERAEIGSTGAERGGWFIEMHGRGTPRPRGIIGNPILYSEIREVGRRPGRMPPPAALMPWVGTKLGIPPGPERESVAFLVARKIGARGYKGSYHMRDGWEAARRKIRPELAKLGLTLSRKVGGR